MDASKRYAERSMHGRDAYEAHLVANEGISKAEADAFLDVLERAEGEDPDMHAGLVAELDARMALAALSAKAIRARDVLAAVASARDTRVGPGDARSLAETARRAL